MLPATREQVTSVVQNCGFPVPNTANDWARQVTVLKNLRRVLDVFQPEIFERDINAMIEASKSKAARKAEGTTLGFWERHRLLKEAKSLLRVGAQVENLHDALQVVARQAEQWRVFVPHGGWPVLPPHLDDIIDTQEQLAADLTALDTVLATTPSGGDLQSLDLNQVETRLKALYDDRLALDTLPERCRLERDFQTVGLGELVGDLNARRVDVGRRGTANCSWPGGPRCSRTSSARRRSSRIRTVWRCRPPRTGSCRSISRAWCAPRGPWWRRRRPVGCAICCSPAPRRRICCTPRWRAATRCR